MQEKLEKNYLYINVALYEIFFTVLYVIDVVSI